jgi:flagellar P-ring protein precursor FlgI
MKKKVTLLLFFFFMLFGSKLLADRLKDLVSIAGIRNNQLLGYGIVIGLNGTGDSTTNLTLQSIQSLISQFDIVVSTSDLKD